MPTTTATKVSETVLPQNTTKITSEQKHTENRLRGKFNFQGSQPQNQTVIRDEYHPRASNNANIDNLGSEKEQRSTQRPTNTTVHQNNPIETKFSERPLTPIAPIVPRRTNFTAPKITHILLRTGEDHEGATRSMSEASQQKVASSIAQTVNRTQDNAKPLTASQVQITASSPGELRHLDQLKRNHIEVASKDIACTPPQSQPELLYAIRNDESSEHETTPLTHIQPAQEEHPTSSTRSSRRSFEPRVLPQRHARKTTLFVTSNRYNPFQSQIAPEEKHEHPLQNSQRLQCIKYIFSKQSRVIITEES